MSSRNMYTAEEWQTLQFAPLAIFNAVGYADGSLSRLETGALMHLLDQASKLSGPETQLVNEVLTSIKNDFSSAIELLNAASGEGLTVAEILSSTGRLLDTKAPPEQMRAFKEVMVILATQVAEAGPLIGKKVTTDERIAVEQISAILGV
jgi:hypothetical protein